MNDAHENASLQRIKTMDEPSYQYSGPSIYFPPLCWEIIVDFLPMWRSLHRKRLRQCFEIREKKYKEYGWFWCSRKFIGIKALKDGIWCTKILDIPNLVCRVISREKNQVLSNPWTTHRTWCGPFKTHIHYESMNTEEILEYLNKENKSKYKIRNNDYGNFTSEALIVSMVYKVCKNLVWRTILLDSAD